MRTMDKKNKARIIRYSPTADRMPMKRIPALQPLSMEHHLSLSLAVKAMRMARSDDEAGKQALCERIVGEYADLWRPHFDAEERCLFEPFHGLSPEIDRLCAQAPAGGSRGLPRKALQQELNRPFTDQGHSCS